MHTLEPFFRWRNLYCAEKEYKSPFFGREYNESDYVNSVYNYVIHPQWDEFGSETLYLKILFSDYEKGYTIIELIGEWNDTLYNDIMFLKRNVIEPLISNGIKRFILIGENVFNYHSSDDSYYEEWHSEIEDGWVVGINFHKHVVQEFLNSNIHQYIFFDEEVYNWRVFSPYKLYVRISCLFSKRISNL